MHKNLVKVLLLGTAIMGFSIFSYAQETGGVAGWVKGEGMGDMTRAITAPLRATVNVAHGVASTAVGATVGAGNAVLSGAGTLVDGVVSGAKATSDFLVDSTSNLMGAPGRVGDAVVSGVKSGYQATSDFFVGVTDNITPFSSVTSVTSEAVARGIPYDGGVYTLPNGAYGVDVIRDAAGRATGVTFISGDSIQHVDFPVSSLPAGTLPTNTPVVGSVLPNSSGGLPSFEQAIRMANPASNTTPTVPTTPASTTPAGVAPASGASGTGAAVPASSATSPAAGTSLTSNVQLPKYFSATLSKMAGETARNLSSGVADSVRNMANIQGFENGLNALKDSMGAGVQNTAQFVNSLNAQGLSNLSNSIDLVQAGLIHAESLQDLGPLALREAYQGLLQQKVYEQMMNKVASQYGSEVAKAQAAEISKQAQAAAVEQAAETLPIKVLTQNVGQYSLLIWEAIKANQIDDASKEVRIKGAEPMGESQGSPISGASTLQSNTPMSATTISGAANSLIALLNMGKIDISLLSTDMEEAEGSVRAISASAGTSGGQSSATGQEEDSSSEDALATRKQREIKKRRALLLGEWAAAASQIGEGSNAISSTFYDRAQAFAQAANEAQGSLGGISAITDTDRFVLFEITRGTALSAIQLGLQGAVNLNTIDEVATRTTNSSTPSIAIHSGTSQ